MDNTNFLDVVHELILFLGKKNTLFFRGVI